MLIVDDNRFFAEMLATALGAVEGVTCVGTASSAVEGFQRVAELRPSVVVMDIMMPGLGGLAATTELRRTSPDTAIAVVSAYSENEWIARAQDAGASAYISKGGSLTDMIEVLRTARPGPMIVAPPLRAAWSSWQGDAPEPETAARARPSALSGPMRILRARTQRAKRDVARGLTAVSQGRRPESSRW